MYVPLSHILDRSNTDFTASNFCRLFILSSSISLSTHSKIVHSYEDVTVTVDGLQFLLVRGTDGHQTVQILYHSTHTYAFKYATVTRDRTTVYIVISDDLFCRVYGSCGFNACLTILVCIGQDSNTQFNHPHSQRSL